MSNSQSPSQPQQSSNPQSSSTTSKPQTSSSTADIRGYSAADKESFEEPKTEPVQGEKHYFKIESLDQDYDDKKWKEDPTKPTMYGQPDKGGVGGTGWHRNW